MAIPFLALVILIPLCVLVISFRKNKKPAPAAVTPQRNLDRVTGVTNSILGILYIPLSLFFSLSGMVSDGFVGKATPVQEAICNVITFLGVLTAPVAFGSLICSILSRQKGRSRLSFWIQFLPLLYIAVIIVLILILEYT